MTWPPPTRDDHERFCRTEGWSPVSDARGRTGTHHVTYELVLLDGRVLRTRVSRPVDRTDYGGSMWAHILRDQLEVDEGMFWACVRDGTPPDRGFPAEAADPLPVELVHLLTTRAGVPEAEIAGMGKEEAVARMQRYWLEGA
ncbi:cytotoxic translational repressor of toxin-antitoxin stability system [Nocardiopsis sp. CC223A]|uniref:cytotoxic translational repressor of toxin-antitoxin stability system n=1 Tax=Nocardiopsis sp. CC223A TaxID=3044051 RepID=UPI00278BB8B7|nr:cytotoxic translational repressor of toxin-antitoxin stability system [Nocardiopsis sp. CC223A]